LTEVRDTEHGKKLLAGAETLEAFERIAAGCGGFRETVLEQGLPHADLGYDLSLQAELFKTPDGQAFPRPVQTRRAVFLLWVVKKAPPRIPQLAQVRDRVLRDFLAIKQKKAADELLDDLRTRYNLEVFEERIEEGD
jgi:hypothetical protein